MDRFHLKNRDSNQIVIFAILVSKGSYCKGCSIRLWWPSEYVDWSFQFKNFFFSPNCLSFLDLDIFRFKNLSESIGFWCQATLLFPKWRSSYVTINSFLPLFVSSDKRRYVLYPSKSSRRDDVSMFLRSLLFANAIFLFFASDWYWNFERIIFSCLIFLFFSCMQKCASFSVFLSCLYTILYLVICIFFIKNILFSLNTTSLDSIILLSSGNYNLYPPLQ